MTTISGPSDDVIQATNDDATCGKAYAVSKGYWKDPHIRHFCTSSVPRAPEINRGYFVRSLTFKAITCAFIKATGGVCQIVNLGAGSDTLYFNLKDDGILPQTYVEVDLKLNVQRKALVILRKQLLKPTQSCKAITGDTAHAHHEVSHGNPSYHYTFESGQFHLLSFDLRRPVHELISLLCLSEDTPLCFNTLPTLFLAECVLVYMPPETSFHLLRGLAEHFTCASFLHYEQVNMEDRFGAVMRNHFRSRSCELPGLAACQSLTAQENRFVEAGWKKAKAWTINQVYNSFPIATRRRIESTEMLDDLEVAGQLFDHYCIVYASNTGVDENLCFWTELEEPLSQVS